MPILITIGIPFFNADQFIEKSIKSVLSQTFESFELILSDDGSTDRSLEIVKSICDPRVIILSDGKNRGISYRLNEQISIAKGKYFARMDSDDIMFPDRLKKQIEFLENNPEVDVVGSYAIVIDDENQILGLRETIVPKTIDNCFKAVPFIHPTVMGKTNWFKKYKYIDELKGVEDADLWIRSFNSSKFGLIQEPLLFYRDPPILKLNTYKFRIFQSIKLYEKNIHLLNNSIFLLLKFKIIAILKLFIYIMLHYSNFESVLINKRNRKLDKSMKCNYENSISIYC